MEIHELTKFNPRRKSGIFYRIILEILPCFCYNHSRNKEIKLIKQEEKNMKIDVKCSFAVKYPHYGKVEFKGINEDEMSWLIDLITYMRNNGIIQHYEIEFIEL